MSRAKMIMWCTNQVISVIDVCNFERKVVFLSQCEGKVRVLRVLAFMTEMALTAGTVRVFSNVMKSLSPRLKEKISLFVLQSVKSTSSICTCNGKGIYWYFVMQYFLHITRWKTFRRFVFSYVSSENTRVLARKLAGVCSLYKTKTGNCFILNSF